MPRAARGRNYVQLLSVGRCAYINVFNPKLTYCNCSDCNASKTRPCKACSSVNNICTTTCGNRDVGLDAVRQAQSRLQCINRVGQKPCCGHCSTAHDVIKSNKQNICRFESTDCTVCMLVSDVIIYILVLLQRILLYTMRLTLTSDNVCVFIYLLAHLQNCNIFYTKEELKISQGLKVNHKKK